MPLVGTTRHVVVAETDGNAMDIARRAYARWYASFMFLWKKHGTTPLFAAFPENFDEAHRAGLAAVGTPETVRAALAAQIGECGVNYLLLRFAFGDLTLEESLRSVDLFARDVRPALATQRALA